MTETAIKQDNPPSEHETFDATLKAAAKLFRNQGYAATTLRQIADAVGIKAGSIYYHFKSKEEILDKVLEAGVNTALDEVKQRVNALPPDASTRQRIGAAIEGHLVGILQHGDFVSANIKIYSQIPAGAKRRHRVLRAVYAAYWDDLLRECSTSAGLRDDIGLSVLRLFVIGALNWTVEWFDPRRGTVEEFVEQISTIIFDGILTHDTPSASFGNSSSRKTRKTT